MSITLLQNGLSGCNNLRRWKHVFHSFILSVYLSYFQDKKREVCACVRANARWIENRVYILLAIKWKNMFTFDSNTFITYYDRWSRALSLFSGYKNAHAHTFNNQMICEDYVTYK